MKRQNETGALCREEWQNVIPFGQCAKELQTIDGESLMNTSIAPIRFVVSTMLPQGLSILAGAPKVGKSWLALQLCLATAKGEALWELPSQQGTVLYLCLEDSYARIQSISAADRLLVTM